MDWIVSVWSINRPDPNSAPDSESRQAQLAPSGHAGAGEEVRLAPMQPHSSKEIDPARLERKEGGMAWPQGRRGVGQAPTGPGGGARWHGLVPKGGKWLWPSSQGTLSPCGGRGHDPAPIYKGAGGMALPHG